MINFIKRFFHTKELAKPQFELVQPIILDGQCTLVFHADRHLAADQLHNFGLAVKAAFPNQKFVVIDAGMRLTHITKDSAPC